MIAVIPWFDVPMVEIPLPGGRALPIHGFGVLVALGFLIGGRVAMNRAARIGLDPERINQVVGWLVVGTFIGGHVGFGLMYQPAEYFADPIKFLQFWHGLSSFGGFVVCVPLAIYFFAKYRLPVWPYLDCLAHGFAMGWFFGRMGCFVAHDHPGSVSDFPLAVMGICRDGPANVACHDMGLYEAIWSIATYGLFVVLDRVRTWPAGFFTLAIGLLYGPLRFFMDFLRPEASDPRYFGYTPGQYGSLLLTGVCLFFLTRLRSREG